MGIYRIIKKIMRVDCRVADAPRNDAKPVVTRQAGSIYPRNDAKPVVTRQAGSIYPRNNAESHVIARRTSIFTTKQSILLLTRLCRKFYDKIKKINTNYSLFTLHYSQIITTILLALTFNACYAFDLDMTVDDDIRKNYNASKLIKDTGADDNINETLPALPDIIKNEPANSADKQVQPSAPQKEITPVSPSSSVSPIYPPLKIHAGASFDVVSSTKINDWLAKGNTIKFKTTKPIVKKKYTIPANTVFTGKITEVHQPQITCNGGLVVVRIFSMTYKGRTIPINAYVTRADGAKIFLNNIKGDRTYWKTVWKKGNWGRTLFNKMTTLTINLGGNGSTLLLSPFPFAYGTICLGLNTIASPFCAFFSKGGHVNIPAGSDFRIKLIDDVSEN